MSDQIKKTALSTDEAALLLPHERGGDLPELNTLDDGLLDEILGEDGAGVSDQDEVDEEVSDEEETDAAEDGPEDEDADDDENDDEVSDEEEADESDEESDEDESEDHREPVAEDAVVFVDEQGNPVTAKEAKLGYLRQADYTKKTQATAQERNTAIQAREQAIGEVQKVQEALEDVEMVMSQMAGDPPDPRLRQQDPGEYAAQVADWQNRQGVIQALRARRQREMQKLERMQADQAKDILAREQQMLSEKLPEWNDPNTRQQELEQIATHFMSEYGYTPQDLSQVQDHRAMLIMRKAMLYDQLQVQGQKTLKDPPKGKVQKSKPRPKPKGKKSMPRGQDGRFKQSRKKALQEQSARLSETGSIQDAARAIETLLGDDLL